MTSALKRVCERLEADDQLMRSDAVSETVSVLKEFLKNPAETPENSEKSAQKVEELKGLVKKHQDALLGIMIDFAEAHLK